MDNMAYINRFAINHRLLLNHASVGLDVVRHRYVVSRVRNSLGNKQLSCNPKKQRNGADLNLGFGFIKRILGKKKEDDPLKHVALHGMVAGESQRPLTQQQLMQELGINIHMIEDENVNALLGSMSVDVENDGNGNPIVKDVDLNMLAMIIMTSKLIRTSFVDPIDSEIGQLDAERFVIRQELDLDEETYELGGTNLNDALSQLIKTGWSDAKNGRKAKLLKVLAKTFEVRIPEAGGKKKEGWV